MYEALRLTDSPYVLYMDDDIAIEPDSILRALAMSRFAKTPMLVGGQMLNLQDLQPPALHGRGHQPPHLHVDRGAVRRVRPRLLQVPDERPGQLEEPAPAHRRRGQRLVDVHDPARMRETIGLPMPLFIKWDDWEFALRAAKAGYPTATVPGIAIWHMASNDKDDAIDWQAYFHLRNRLVVASIHHDGPINGILTSMAKATAKHLLCLEYSTVAIQNEAIH